MGLGSAAVVAPPAASGAFSPLSLTPALWVDPSDAASVTISGSSGAYIGPNGLVLTGGTSDYASTPYLSAYSITDDIDIIAKVSLTDWTPAVLCVLVNTVVGAGSTGYCFYVENTTGNLVLLNGGVTNYTSTAATGFTDGTVNWVRVTRVRSTGTVKFYTSSDGSSWTQLGSDVVSGVGTAITTGSVFTCGRFGTTIGCSGTIYRIIVKNGIAGTTVFDADFDAATPFVSAFTESALGAPVYVVSSTATSSTASYGYVGPNGLVLPGATGSYASTPHAAAISLANDMDIRAYVVSTPTWTPAATSGFVCKKNSGSVAGWRFALNTNGTLLYTIGAVADYSSTVAVPFSAGQGGWVRVTRQQSTGDVKFYTSSDGSSWSQLGTTVAGSTTTTMTNTESLFVGYGQTTGNPFLGTIGRAIVYSDLTETTKVFDANFVTLADYATSFTESSSNAATVTITATNTPANAAGACVSQINDKSGNARHLTQGTLANMPKYWNGRNGNNCLVFDGSNDTLTVAGSIVSQPDSVIVAARSTSSNKHIFGGGAGAVQELYDVSGSTIRASAGLEVALAATTSNRHIYVVTFDGASSKLRSDGGAGSSGSMSTGNMTNGFRLSGNSSGSFPMAGEVQDVVIVSGAISVSDLNNLGPYMAAKANTTWTTAT